MKQAIVWGATTSAEDIYIEIERDYEIVGFCDNNPQKHHTVLVYSEKEKEIFPPDELRNLKWDVIVIVSLSACYAIKQQLLDMGIDEGKIVTRYIELRVNARVQFMENFAKIVSLYNIKGEVAEAGVFQGEFAKEINRNFLNKKLFLFDTFEGFPENDTLIEQRNGYSKAKAGELSITSEQLVLNKMLYKENVVIRKGYFPNSAEGLDEKFCFVSIDFDLYNPTIAALKYFWPRMSKGGIILVHDYWPIGYQGIKTAIHEFTDMKDDIIPFPIGDGVSIALQK